MTFRFSFFNVMIFSFLNTFIVENSLFIIINLNSIINKRCHGIFFADKIIVICSTLSFFNHIYPRLIKGKVRHLPAYLPLPLLNPFSNHRGNGRRSKRTERNASEQPSKVNTNG